MKCFFSLICALLLIACVEDVDLNQADNFQLTPKVESDVFYFTIEAARFADSGGNPIATVQDYSDVELFNDDFIKDNLKKAELFFEFTNSIQKNLNLTLELLDASDQVLQTINVDVSQGTQSNATVTTHTELYEGASLSTLKESVKIRFTIALPDTNDILQDGGVLRLRSKGTFYMNVTVGG